jgi:hypothetical protein
MSLSLHAASARSAYYFFVTIQTIAVSIFIVFMYQWLIPQLHLDQGFQLLFAFTIVCLYATLLIPDTKGMWKWLHRFFAYTMAGMLPITIAYILTTSHLSLITQMLGGTAVLYMTYCLVTFAIVRKTLAHFMMRNYLILQVAYLVSFQLFILSVTYLG